MFFLATADADGQPDCSYKGGVPGFVRITGASELSFPAMTATACSAAWATCWPTRGSGCCSWTSRSRGGCGCSAARGLEEPRGEFDGEQLVVRVHAEQIFPNCPRYLHRMTMVETSVYAPCPGHQPPEPAWKKSFRDVLPDKDPTAG
jgi:hypothetical protein